MIFNSIDFAWFLPLVFLIYWALGRRGLKAQNFWLLLTSMFFYGWWDWRFLGLLMMSVVIDYRMAILMEQFPSRKKAFLWVSLVANLGVLGFFKYFNFFIGAFKEGFTFAGHAMDGSGLEIVLPVGISFYTFQTLGYVIDVYRGQLPASRDAVSFGAFVSFFPQLVAGPIERASHLLPQFQQPRVFVNAQAHDGLRQMLWGFFKKLVIADNCATLADGIFGNAHASPVELVMGAFFFSFQIYGDFSGYSDIASGTAKLFGFKLMRNFNLPYFSRDIAEFWRRWHISLSTWFRDYVYIPLGGSKGSRWMNIRNVMIVFLLSGFWHGANWTFIMWGALHALFFLPLLLTRKNRVHLDIPGKGRVLPSLREFLQMAFTFSCVALAWVFFRSRSAAEAFDYFLGLVNGTWMLADLFNPGYLITVAWILVMIALEWFTRGEEHVLAVLGRDPRTAVRVAGYYIILLVIFWFGGKEQIFIYFQF